MWSNNIGVSWLLVWLQVGYDLQGRLLVPLGATILGHLGNSIRMVHPNMRLLEIIRNGASKCS